jgi:hypothetical protein
MFAAVVVRVTAIVMTAAAVVAIVGHRRHRDHREDTCQNQLAEHVHDLRSWHWDGRSWGEIQLGSCQPSASPSARRLVGGRGEAMGLTSIFKLIAES